MRSRERELRERSVRSEIHNYINEQTWQESDTEVNWFNCGLPFGHQLVFNHARRQFIFMSAQAIQSNQVPWLWLKAAIVMCVHFKAEPRKFTLSMPQTERFTSINCTAITLRRTIIVHNLCMTFAVFPSLSSRSKNYYISWFSRILNLIKLINYQKENADDEEVTRKFMRWLYDGMIMRTWIFGYKLIQGFICFVTTSTGRRKLFIINSSWKINVFT